MPVVASRYQPHLLNSSTRPYDSGSSWEFNSEFNVHLPIVLSGYRPKAPNNGDRFGFQFGLLVAGSCAREHCRYQLALIRI